MLVSMSCWFYAEHHAGFYELLILCWLQCWFLWVVDSMLTTMLVSVSCWFYADCHVGFCELLILCWLPCWFYLILCWLPCWFLWVVCSMCLPCWFLWVVDSMLYTMMDSMSCWFYTDYHVGFCELFVLCWLPVGFCKLFVLCWLERWFMWVINYMLTTLLASLSWVVRSMVNDNPLSAKVSHWGPFCKATHWPKKLPTLLNEIPFSCSVILAYNLLRYPIA